MSYFHCGNGYPDRCNGYRGPLDASVCTSGRHKYDENGRQIPDHSAGNNGSKSEK